MCVISREKTMNNSDERLMKIEMALANCEKTIEELNQVVIEQSKIIDALLKQGLYVASVLSDNDLKPQNEETPPPHY
ncbi:MAG: SlyX family protein [Alphaproteobacteria bacterium]|nr:SlyX family protein [Alphaproteobacteria bacterium]